MLQAPSPASQTVQQRGSEVVKAYIVAYYYAALTNVICQAYLQPIEQVEEDNLRTIIDASYKDFGMLDDYFATLDPAELRTNPNWDLFQQARDLWKPWLRNWTIIAKGNQRTGLTGEVKYLEQDVR